MSAGLCIICGNGLSGRQLKCCSELCAQMQRIYWKHNPVYMQGERERERNRQQKNKLNPVYMQRERERKRESNKKRRQKNKLDPVCTQRERERNKQRWLKNSLNPVYMQRNRERVRKNCLNPVYLQKKKKCHQNKRCENKVIVKALEESGVLRLVDFRDGRLIESVRTSIVKAARDLGLA